MNIETNKEKLCINQIIGQKKEIIEIEGDVIIPDIKPDILNTVNTNGNVYIYKKEVLEGKVRIDGCINVDVIYLADTEDSTTRGLSTSIDFTKIIEMKEAKIGMDLECKNQLNEIECRILNGRKISIKGVLDINLKLTSNEEVEFIETTKNLDDIQMLNKNLHIDSLIGYEKTKVIAKDNNR